MTTNKRVRGRWAAAGVMAAALGLGAGCRGGGPVQPVAAGPLDGGFRAPCSVGASLSLTASDGTGLRLVSVRSRGVVDEPLAFTELRLTFDNPEERQLEGTFSITLPPGATVSRFAMLIDGAWQEGEVVERRAATEAYEDFLHRKQDPALLEQAAGNQFSARVFPIPARGRKELIVSYSQELRAGEPYAVPLKGLPEVEELDLQVHAPGSAEPARALRRSYAAPGGDFVLPRAAGPEAALRDGGRAVARVRPLAEARPEPLSSLLVLFDTSASRALGFGAQVATLRRLLADVAAREGAGVPVTVLCFDQDVETVFEGAAGDFDAEAAAKIKARRALGASDLEAALGAAGRLAKARGLKRVLVVSDGVPTAGDAGGERVGAAARALGRAGVERVDALAVGGIRDDAMLAHVARAGLARDGVVVGAGAEFDEVSRRLRATTQSVELRVEGASWQHPRQVGGLQPGDEVIVYAELPAGRPLKISAGGAPLATPEARAAEPALLQRGLARAKIASLLEAQRRGAGGDELVKQVVELSVKHRVLSPYTALLVLETEEDYARFQLDRRALADVLTVANGAIATAQRGAREPSPVARGGPGGGEGRPVEPASSPRPRRPAAPAGEGEAGCETPEQEAAKAAAKDQPAGAPGGQGAAASARGGGASGGQGAAASARGGGAPGGRAAAASDERAGGAPSGRAAAASDERAGGDARERRAPEPIAEAKPESVGASRSAGPSRPAPAPTAAPAGVRSGAAAPPVPAVMPAPPPPAPAQAEAMASRPHAVEAMRVEAMRAEEPRAEEPQRAPSVEPYTGKFKVVMDLIAAGGAKRAVAYALAWVEQAPGNVMALVALGAAYEAAGEARAAARAYGSLVDLFPSRADLRRFAGARLEHVGGGKGLPLAIDTFRKAVEQRPDHPSSHRLLAFALAKRGAHAEAFEAALAGATRDYPGGRFRGVDRVLREDAGLLGAALVRARPGERAAVEARLRRAGAELETAPSLRFVLNWETDANDVDFHVYDADGGHAFFQQRTLPDGGGELYADVTTGYGPECFTVRKPRDARSPWYKLQAHYYSRGPMGYGMGKLEIIDHDGKGGLRFDERPFVIMADDATVELGKVSSR